MSGDTVRLGLIGAGRWGRNYIKTLDGLPGVVLARLASSNPESASLVDDDCVVSKDWRAVAIADDIDGVIIATPPHLHAEMMTTAVAANKAVLVEKPLTQDLSEAEKLLEIARAEQAIVHVDHIHLYNPAYRELKRLAAGMGPIRTIHGSAGAWGPFRPETSVLWDWGAHDVSMVLDLLGTMPETIQAESKEARQTPEGFGEALDLKLTFPEGIVATIGISNLREEKARHLTVDFDREALIYDDVGDKALIRKIKSGTDENSSKTDQVVKTSDRSPLEQAVMDFVAAIENKQPDLAGLELGVRVVRVLSDCEQALREG